MPRILFCDAESASLRGQIFAAALVGDDGAVKFNGYYQHAILQDASSWVAQNVHLSGTEYADRLSFLHAFLQAFEGCREGYGYGDHRSLAVCAHMPASVESNLFQQLYEEAGLGEFQGPYHLLSTDTVMWCLGEDAPDSESQYANRNGLVLPQDYHPHSSLSDAQLTRVVWQHLQTRITSFVKSDLQVV